MHFERLAIEAGANTFTLDFHERLTVIAGVGRLERDGLVNELVSGLSKGRPGVHLEVRSDAGERYALFRPSSGPPRVVDIDKATDVTASFTDSAGNVNILERAGLTTVEAKRSMCLGASELATSQGDTHLERLARIDPNRLWDVARKVVDRQARLDELAEDLGSAVEDLGAFEEVERRHRDFEGAQAEAERTRSWSFLIAAGCAIASLPGLLLLGPLVALPLLTGAGLAGFISLLTWSRAKDAQEREARALAAIGERSYLTFQVNRVSGLVASESQRTRLMQAAAEHRAALSQWELLAGDVSPNWALEHRRKIAEAHNRLREAHGESLGTALSVGGAGISPVTEIEDSLDRYLHRIRHLGAGGESFPTFLDDPFTGLDVEQKNVLLDTVLRHAADQQIVLLTSDADVIDWSRLEAIGGDLSLVEPAGEDPARSNGQKRRSRHVAA